MNDEIKEILDRLDYNEWDVDLYKVPITWCELYDIRDYITNLQQENERLKKPDYYEKGLIGSIKERDKIIQDYKSRCEKASEDIKFCLHSIKQEYEMSTDERTRNEMESCVQIFNKTLNILQNGSENDE